MYSYFLVGYDKLIIYRTNNFVFAILYLITGIHFSSMKLNLESFFYNKSSTCIIDPSFLFWKSFIVFLPAEVKNTTVLCTQYCEHIYVCSCTSSIRIFCTSLFLSALFCYVIISSLCVCSFSAVSQMQRRGRPRDSLWTAFSITPLCCSAKRTTCCTSEPGRHCLPSASRTSARPSSRRTWVWPNGSLEAKLQ